MFKKNVKHSFKYPEKNPSQTLYEHEVIIDLCRFCQQHNGKEQPTELPAENSQFSS